MPKHYNHPCFFSPRTSHFLESLNTWLSRFQNIENSNPKEFAINLNSAACLAALAGSPQLASKWLLSVLRLGKSGMISKSDEVPAILNLLRLGYHRSLAEGNTLTFTMRQLEMQKKGTGILCGFPDSIRVLVEDILIEESLRASKLEALQYLCSIIDINDGAEADQTLRSELQLVCGEKEITNQNHVFYSIVKPMHATLALKSEKTIQDLCDYISYNLYLLDSNRTVGAEWGRTLRALRSVMQNPNPWLLNACSRLNLDIVYLDSEKKEIRPRLTELDTTIQRVESMHNVFPSRNSENSESRN